MGDKRRPAAKCVVNGQEKCPPPELEWGWPKSIEPGEMSGCLLGGSGVPRMLGSKSLFDNNSLEWGVTWCDSNLWGWVWGVAEMVGHKNGGFLVGNCEEGGVPELWGS